MITELKNVEDKISNLHSNIMLLRSQHGDVVAMSHNITSNGFQSTTFYFFDGFVYSVSCLYLGVPNQENAERFLMLFFLINEMPMMQGVMSNQQDLIDIYLDNEDKLSEEKKTIHIIFIPPYHTLDKDHIINYSKGLAVIEEMNSIVYVDDKIVLIQAFNYEGE